jgi:hypothetical protein
MVTTHQKITLGQSSLQGFWTRAQGETNQNVRSFPDERLSVCETGCVSKSLNSDITVKEPGKRHSPSDSLLGSLLAESFVGAAFAPLLPLWAQEIDWTLAMEATDTVWMDRRTAPLAAPARAPAPFGLF